MKIDDKRLNNAVWLADRATPKLPVGAVPEHFVPGVSEGKVTSIPVSWLPSALGEAVAEILKLRAELRALTGARKIAD